MQRIAQKLAFVTLATLILFYGAMAFGSPAEQSPDQELDPQEIQAEIQNAPTAEPQAEEPFCEEMAADSAEALFDLGPISQPAMSPCCQALCDQVCGVGEHCVCHRCQVVGCSV
jgi:hypothetical protein